MSGNIIFIKDCEIYYPVLDPKKPNARFSKTRPTWEVQLRTTSTAQKKEWEELGLKVKPVIPEDAPPFFRVMLKKPSAKFDGTLYKPVEVVDTRGVYLDPKRIGNGSMADIKLFQRTYLSATTGKEELSTMLLGLQITKLCIYEPNTQQAGYPERAATVVVNDTPDDTEFEKGENNDDVPF